MQEIKKALLLDKKDYFETHLSLVNCVLPKKMTPKEIEVLAAFMCLEGRYAGYRFSTPSRKQVMLACGMTPQSMSNHIKSLKDKGFLIENGMVEILPLLIPEKNQQDYRIRLRLGVNLG